MKNLPTLLAAIVVVVIVAFYMCTYQVRFTEVAIVETFGEPAGEPDREPGLRYKWPWPIQTVVKFDKRIRVLEDRTEETYTSDSKNIIVTTSTFWTIEDPYKFHRAFQRVVDGERQLRDAVRSQKKAVIGRYDFANFVSTDPSERKLREMEEKMLWGAGDSGAGGGTSLAGAWLENYGVGISYFGITKLTLPTSVTQAIFASMKKTEENKAKNYEAEGEARASQIVSAAQEARERIMSVANRKATEIRNEGEKIVSELYASFEEHQDLRIFLDKLRTIRDSFDGDTTLILDQNMVPFDLFKLGNAAARAPGGIVDNKPRVIPSRAGGE